MDVDFEEILEDSISKNRSKSMKSEHQQSKTHHMFYQSILDEIRDIDDDEIEVGERQENSLLFKLQNCWNAHRVCLLSILVIMILVLIYGYGAFVQKMFAWTPFDFRYFLIPIGGIKGPGTTPPTPTPFLHTVSIQCVGYILGFLTSAMLLGIEKLYSTLSSMSKLLSRSKKRKESKQKDDQRKHQQQPSPTKFWLYICMGACANFCQFTIFAFFERYLFGVRMVARQDSWWLIGYYTTDEVKNRIVCLIFVFLFQELFLTPRLRYKFPHIWVSMSCLLCVVFYFVLEMLFSGLFIFKVDWLNFYDSPRTNPGVMRTVCQNNAECNIGANLFYFLYSMILQVPIAIQMIIEQKLFETNRSLTPLSVIFWESMLCIPLTFFFLFVLYWIPGDEYMTDYGSMENFPATLYQITQAPLILVAVYLLTLINGISWFLGLYVTKYLSSFSRAAFELIATTLPVIIIFMLYTIVISIFFILIKKLSVGLILGLDMFMCLTTVALILTCCCANIASEVGLGCVCPKYFRSVEISRRKMLENVKEQGAIERMKTEKLNEDKRINYVDENVYLL